MFFMENFGLSREIRNKYLIKHVGVDLENCSLGDFVKANADKIKIRRNDNHDFEYILTDRKLVCYYDYLCFGDLLESLRSSKREEAVLGISDLSWFVNKLKRRYIENKES